MIAIHHPWGFAFGLLGNVISFMVFLAPMPTFIRIFKKKSTEGFQSVPYVVAIFSCLLWIYYALLKGNTILLITINIAGVVIETIYIVIFISYAPKQAKISTLNLFLLLNFVGFCSIVLLCHYLVKGDARIQVFGWICVGISISVFAAPLSIMVSTKNTLLCRGYYIQLFICLIDHKCKCSLTDVIFALQRLVIRTKSVEYMPFNLSLCLTLTAVIWFMYGMLQKDLYVTLPNVVGFMFGVAQMTLYGIYRKYDKEAEKQKLPEQAQVSSPAKQSKVEIHPNNSLSPNQQENITPTRPVAEEIEVVVVNPRKEEDDFVNEDNLHGLLQGQTCNVEAQKVVGGPGPSSVHFVECAV
ncbi:hypothetical protein Cgig2_014254 [Carnegiea gigantea]|uniref:Sugar transporter SWEET1 n=1 Tax=Carnegiea gigantea TaxID=171969 RepID=A0A9Q1QB31_9CARY|nr:hypothetical protein Cgig2_014254 [Carnegiea gigantea]